MSTYCNLPLDIIHHILSYNDAIKWRNGKYMNQLSKSDMRYQLLKTVSKPRVDIFIDGHFEWIIKFKDVGESIQLRIYWAPNRRKVIYQYYCLLYSENGRIFFEILY